VSLPWDWVCDELTNGQLEALQNVTTRQLAITNRASAASVQ
jgi:hypothetical protein